MTTTEIRQMSNDQLLAETARAAATERRSTAELLVLLIEVERRGLHAAMGYSSLFTYCTRALHLSEQAAYSRITAARAVRRWPALRLLELLANGPLTLSSLGLLAPHLTEENHEALVTAAKHKSTRDVERLIASLHPQPDIASSLRAVPVARLPGVAEDAVQPTAPLTEAPLPSAESATTSSAASPPSASLATGPRPRLLTAPSRAVLAPLGARRFWLKVTIGQETHDKLQRARDLLRHVIPDGDPAAILDRALTLLVEQASRTKYAAIVQPRSSNGGPRSNAAALLLRMQVETQVRPQSPARDRQADRGRDQPTDRGRDRMKGRARDRPEGRLRAGQQQGQQESRDRAEHPARSAEPKRYIPAEVRRAVWQRDRGRCAFVGTAGRCRETGFLEFHHVVPFAARGPTDAGNLQLRCRAHNAHEERVFFGADRVGRPRSAETRPSAGPASSLLR